MNGLRVALDARELPLGPSGDRTYLLNLLREFAVLAPQDTFLLCYQMKGEDGLEGKKPSNAKIYFLPARPGWLWTPWAWPRFLRRAKAHLAHAQHIVPPLAPCPTIVTIHDVSFLRYPEWFPARSVRIMRRLIPFSARRATHIITGSQHAAQEIAALCHVPQHKISVIYYGVGAQFSPQNRAEAREKMAVRYGLRQPFLLAVGLIQPRKNLSRLLQAFALIKDKYPELCLAIVGRAAWGWEELQKQLASLGLAQRIVLLGAVPDADLPDVYRAAEMLVYPSLYEGFGLPPLEAMACGTPVVASNTTSLPEVVGEAGVLVDPYEPEAIAEGIIKLLEDRSLATQLAQKGLARAQQFSWRRCAQQHLEIYQRLAKI